MRNIDADRPRKVNEKPKNDPKRSGMGIFELYNLDVL